MMDQNLARWSQIVFWDEGDVVRLHKLEKWRNMRLPPSGVPRYQTTGMDGPQAGDLIQYNQARYMIRPFWPRGVTTAMQEERMREFERRIYPIWKSIFEHDGAADAEGPGIQEMESLHKADMAIFNSGSKPDRRPAASSRESRRFESDMSLERTGG